MKPLSRPACYALAGLLAAGLALNVVAFRHAHAMLHYASGGIRTESPERLSPGAKLRVLLSGVRLPRPEDARPATVLSPDARVLSIPSTDGATLCAWHADGGPGAPLVILFHGYSTEKSRLLFEARGLLAMGTSVLLVDFRGSGGSSESYSTLGWREADDVAAAVRYSLQHLPHSRLVLYGQSMGSAAILRAIHAHGIHPNAVILESVFDTLLNALRNRFHAMGIPAFPGAQLLAFWGGALFGFNAFRHNPADDAASLSCPALFLHGADDPRATLPQARRVFDAARGPKQFIVFDAVGHGSYAEHHPRQWQSTVQPFLEAPPLCETRPAITK